MKILFLTDNFPPEVNAPATRTYEHCVEWVKQGADVTVITCFPNFPQGKVYEGYKNKLYQKEIIDGIKVIRVWTYIYANEGFLRRTIDYISFSVSSFIAGLFLKFDIVIGTSPQFFTALSARTLSFFKHKPWIMEVRDLWPESIKTVGAMKDGIFIKYFEWQEKRCYKSAKKIITVTDSFKHIITKKGIPENKIYTYKNGVNAGLFKPMPKDEDLLKELKLNNKFIIGFIGTHGLAHKLDFILRAAKKIENKDIHFLFVGDGAQKQNLLKISKELELENVTMLDSISKQNVPKYISIIDVALINLRKSDLFKSVIPSKIFENAAMNKPILLGVEGESKQIVEQFNIGLAFEPESKKDFLNKIDVLYNQKDSLSFYSKGCRKLSEEFDRKKIATDYLNTILAI